MCTRFCMPACYARARASVSGPAVQDNRVCSHKNPWYDIPPYRSLVYFKRGWLHRYKSRTDPATPPCPLNTAPIHFAMFDHWVLPYTVPWPRRRYSVVCTIRARQDVASASSGGRWNVVQWLKAEEEAAGMGPMHIGPITGSTDNCIDLKYLRLLHSAKIVVTCQPAYWETDYRTWEALSSGALVFIDPTTTPMPFAPEDKVALPQALSSTTPPPPPPSRSVQVCRRSQETLCCYYIQRFSRHPP